MPWTQSRAVHVSVAHRHWRPDWDAAKNRAVYGDWASPAGVGSDWRVEVAVSTDAEFDWAPVTERIRAAYHRRCLWRDVAAFQVGPLTLERAALHLARIVWPAGAGDGFYLRIVESGGHAVTARPGREEVELHARLANLTLLFRGAPDPESGWLARRPDVAWAVRRVAPDFARGLPGESETQWMARLTRALRAQLTNLVEVRADLGHNRFLSLNIDT